MTKNKQIILVEKQLVDDLRELIHQTRDNVARSVNSSLIILYWKIGRRIKQDILKEERAEYGKKIIETLSRQLYS